MQRLFFIENFGSLKLLRSLCLKYKASSKLQDKNLLMIEITACHIINFHNSAFFLSSLFHLILRNKKTLFLSQQTCCAPISKRQIFTIGQSSLATRKAIEVIQNKKGETRKIMQMVFAYTLPCG